MVEGPADAGQVEAEIEGMDAELEALADEEESYEFVEVHLGSLTEEQLKAQFEILDQQLKQAKKRIETNRRAVNPAEEGKSGIAMQSPEEKWGEPCRAPVPDASALTPNKGGVNAVEI